MYNSLNKKMKIIFKTKLTIAIFLLFIFAFVNQAHYNTQTLANGMVILTQPMRC